MTTARCASIRRDRMSPPCGFGAKPPVPRRAASQRITDDTDTPKRPAAERRLMPPSTAASALALKSIESGLPIPPPRYPPQEQRIRPGPTWESPTAIQIGRATLYDPGRQVEDVDNWVCNRADNDYEMSDGKGFKEWWAEREAIVTGHYLRKAARIIKYVRDTKGTFSAKSVLLTTLIGMQIQDDDASEIFTDVPTTLKIVLERLDAWLQERPELPAVENPALEGESFTRNWSQSHYDNFRNRIGDFAEWAADAYDEQNRDESIRKWRRLLGDEFGKGETSDRAKQAVRKLAEELAHGADLVSAVSRWGAQMLNRIPHNLPHVEPTPFSKVGQQITLLVKATERKSRGTAAFRTLQSGEPIFANRGIEFQTTQISGLPLPKDYEVFWQVVNTDEAAANANALRGGFEKSDTHGFRYEGTLYRGVHWAQAFAVNRRTNFLAGKSERFFVVIT